MEKIQYLSNLFLKIGSLKLHRLSKNIYLQGKMADLFDSNSGPLNLSTKDRPDFMPANSMIKREISDRYSQSSTPPNDFKTTHLKTEAESPKENNYNTVPPTRFMEYISSQVSTSSQYKKDHVKKVLHRPSSSFPYPSHQTSHLMSTLSSRVFQENSEDIETVKQLIRARSKRLNNHTNHNMRRVSSTSENKNNDPEYLEKRKKNNESAKRSRDARRAKEEELIITNELLIRKNTELEAELKSKLQLIKQLKDMMYQSPGYVRLCQPI